MHKYDLYCLRLSFNWHQRYGIFRLRRVFPFDLNFRHIFCVIFQRIFTWWSWNGSPLSTRSIAISVPIPRSAPFISTLKEYKTQNIYKYIFILYNETLLINILFENYIFLDESSTCLYHDPCYDPFCYAPLMSCYPSRPFSLYSPHHPFPFHAPSPFLSPPTMLEASLVLPNLTYYNIM